MTDQDKKQFAAIMGGMAEVYGREISKQALALQFKVLEQFGIEEIQAAAVSILASRKYTSMPTPADFLEHINGGSAEDKAEVEAGKVLAAIEAHGPYRSVVFDDPVTQAVIVQAYGGWPRLCTECDVEPTKWFRKEFSKTWAAYSRQGLKTFGVLAGLSEIQNTAGGHLNYIDPPRLVGDSEKARAVLEAGQDLALGSTPRGLLPEGCFHISDMAKRIRQ